MSLELQELKTSNAEKYVDVVFVHGLGGNAKTSWETPQGDYWPKWLCDDFPNMRVTLLQYPSAFFKPKQGESDFTFDQRADGILSHLISNGYGERPIVFICHSLGGLIVQQMISRAVSNANDNWKCLGENVKGVVLLGVPQRGASVATLLGHLQVSSKICAALDLKNEDLEKITKSFCDYVVKSGCKVCNFSEGKAMGGVTMLVPHENADLKLVGSPCIRVDEDHVSISKLHTREKEVFGATKALLEKLQETLIEPQKLQALEDSISNDQLLKYQKPADRLTLQEKLKLAGREYDIIRALRQKADMAKAIASGATTISGRKFYNKLCGDVETRFNGVIPTMVAEGASKRDIDAAVLKDVIAPIVNDFKEDKMTISGATVSEAISYLTGHCFIRWHND